MTETFVATRALNAAIEGRETEILGALGIEWNGRATHIDCPYPSHGGRNDWRWDAKKKRAFCTCNDPSRADTIMHVVQKCTGLDFEGAKVRAAELIGRQDLIRTKGSGGGQRQDPESLLNPPAETRDDGLPRAYLAHRLGIEPAAVVMPSTPTAGFSRLGYFDPAQGGKFTHVGDFPCAIFGQRDADGRTHAHRIYLDAGGLGKADLGRRENGSERDAKKSASRASEDDNTAGRAVLWGDAARSGRIILCEGIETGAAIAYAYRAEIEARTVAVAAGVSAGGLEAFTPYAATERVTVAADRDEKITPSKPKASRRGEVAARQFGLRHHGTLTVDIALPGLPATKADWLDVLRGAGPEAVRAGINAAAPFKPTPAEVAAYAERMGGEAELARIAAECPLPTLYGTTLEYRRFGSEVWAHKAVTVGKGEDRETIFVPVFTPFGIPARLRFADGAESYGLRLVVLDMGGRPRPLDVDRADFARMGAAEAKSLLYGAGLRTMDEGEKLAVECLKAAGPDREIIVVRKPGWHEVEGLDAPIFVCPDGAVLGLPDSHTLELAAGAQLAPSIARGGTLQGWKDAAATAVGVTGCQHWTLGVMAAFAGPLVSLAGLDTCGFNLSGLTSAGKTTGQRLAASAWSKATTTKDSLFQSARATVNSVEHMASRANGTVLVLDELAHVTGKELGRIIYTLAGSTGKKRMTPGATVRDSYTWSTFAVLSAETSLEEKVRKDGGEWTGGQTVRMADIDVTGVDRNVSAETLARIGGIKANYGHAGPAFVAAMIAAGVHRDPQGIRDTISELAQRIARAGLTTETPDSATIRAANVFAILATAGSMAQQFGLIPAGANVNGVVRWAWDRFQASTEALALDPEQQAISNLQTWIAERWGVTLHDLHAEARPTREALGWFDDDGIYIPTARLAEAAGGTLKEPEIAKALKARGGIIRTKSERHTYVEYVSGLGKVKAYALSREHFGRGSDRSHLKVFNGGRP